MPDKVSAAWPCLHTVPALQATHVANAHASTSTHPVAVFSFLHAPTVWFLPLQEGAIRLATSEQATRNMTPTDKQVGHCGAAFDSQCQTAPQSRWRVQHLSEGSAGAQLVNQSINQSNAFSARATSSACGQTQMASDTNSFRWWHLKIPVAAQCTQLMQLQDGGVEVSRLPRCSALQHCRSPDVCCHLPKR